MKRYLSLDFNELKGDMMSEASSRLYSRYTYNTIHDPVSPMLREGFWQIQYMGEITNEIALSLETNHA